MHVVRKTRVETYLKPETVEQIEETGMDKSAYIREAVRRQLQRDMIGDNDE